MSDYVAQVTVPANPRDAEVPPAYPVAQDLRSQQSQFLNQPDEFFFFTDDSLHTVADFYNVVLEKIGWSSETPYEGSNYYDVRFTWHDNDASLPYSLVMQINIRDGCKTDPYARLEDNTSFVNKRCVKITPLRKPYASRIPLSIGAREIQTKDTPSSLRPPYLTRTTEYITNSTPEEIKSFYLSRMQDYGWVLEAVLEKRASDEIAGGITFIDPTTPEQEVQRPRAIISATARKDGLTLVKVVAEGPELNTRK